MVNHPVICRGPSFGDVPSVGAPLLVERAAVDVVPDLFSALSNGTLEEVISCSEQAPGKLLHPAQRMVTLALLEAVCESAGEPRLHPAKIDSAGLVVRRVAQDGDGNPIWSQSEGWMSRSDGSRCWQFLTQREAKLDPDPARRRRLGSGSAYLDAQFAQLGPLPFRESTASAYVAPPQLCSVLKKTVLFGIVPTSDSQVVRAPQATAPPAPPSDSDLEAIVPVLLKAGGRRVPLANQTIDSQYSSNEFLEQKASIDKSPEQSSYIRFKQFLALLQAAVVQYGIFEGSKEGNAVLAAISEIAVQYPVAKSAEEHNPGDTIKNLGDLLKQADAVLLNPDEITPPITKFTMPDTWSEISDQQAAKIFEAIKDALAKKTKSLLPQEGRFDDPNRYYRVRGFIRVKDDGACPPRIVWTQESGPFQIAPWYEGGKLPPVHIPLPDPTDRNALKNLKPNVSFRVPGALQRMMQSTSMKGLTDGKPSGGGGVTVDWICAFSLPIITICAFFVLNIFLTLLNLVFWWMLFIKICIPIPIPKFPGSKKQP